MLLTEEKMIQSKPMIHKTQFLPLASPSWWEYQTAVSPGGASRPSGWAACPSPDDQTSSHLHRQTAARGCGISCNTTQRNNWLSADP